jgi:hypothetical protein
VQQKKIKYIKVMFEFFLETLTGIKLISLDIDYFCKKSQNKSILAFHLGAYGFCTSAPGSAQLLATFFLNIKVCQVTPRERSLRKEYNALFVI